MALVERGGLDTVRLDHLRSVIEGDIRGQRYFGAVILVARHGEVGLSAALGYGDENRMHPVLPDSVVNLFALTKAFTNVLALRAVEQGRLALTTRVVEVIPEFTGRGRDQISLLHLFTHSSGLPGVHSPRSGMPLDRLEPVIAAICEHVFPAGPPGDKVCYSPMVNHALMGEMVRRCESRGRSFSQIVAEDILQPLRMDDTAVGLRRNLKSRHLAPEFRGNSPIDHPGSSNLGSHGAFQEEDAQMPWAGMVSTAQDMFRFAEMLRRGGELDGVRLLSPPMLECALRCHTGAKPNDLYRRLAEARGWPVIPAYLGLGFSLRGGEIGNTVFGTLTSPGTFGNNGSSTCLYWVDPERDMTFIALTTGVMNSGDSIERWQRLSDIAVSAAL